MATIEKQNQDQLISSLKRAIARQAEVELAGAGEDPVLAVRLLAVEEETLVVSHPIDEPGATALRKGERVDVRLVLSLRDEERVVSKRWSLRSKVVESFAFDLGAKQTPALRLSWPTEIKPHQRRDHFRVQTIGQDRPELRVWLLQDIASAEAAERALQQANRDRVELDAEAVAELRPNVGPAFEALTSDLSGGGLCMIVPEAVDAKLAGNPSLWVELNVPGGPLLIAGVAKVAHRKPMQVQRKGQGQKLIRVGLAMLCTRPEFAEGVAERLCRLAAEIQRQQLRRTRGA